VLAEVKEYPDLSRRIRELHDGQYHILGLNCSSTCKWAIFGLCHCCIQWAK